MIHESIAKRDQNRGLDNCTQARLAPRTGTRLFAELVWRTTWQAGKRVYGALCWSALAQRVYRERRELVGLSDEQLKDIGLTRIEADREANRHWSDLPRSRQDGNDW